MLGHGFGPDVMSLPHALKWATLNDTDHSLNINWNTQDKAYLFYFIIFINAD